jgi:hypothetical protein
VTYVNSANAKLFGALIGGCAILALSGFAVMNGEPQSGNVGAAHSASMSVGATSTESTPPGVPAISMAVPTMKGPAPLPSEEQAAE